MRARYRILSSPLVYCLLSSTTKGTFAFLSASSIAARTISSSRACSTSNQTAIMEGLPTPLILGSGSFTRKLILGEMEIPFHVVKRPIDEGNIGNRDTDTPQDLVLTLAMAKAHHLVSEFQHGNIRKDELPNDVEPESGWIVLTGDQVVTHDGAILEKPCDIDQAKSFVSRYATSPPSTVGSVVLTHFPSGIQVSGVDSATIVFRPSVANVVDDKDLVDLLLEEDAPILSCAGGLMVEHALVKEHIERIDGTEDSVMGLSKDLVWKLLDEMRVKLREANILHA